MSVGRSFGRDRRGGGRLESGWEKDDREKMELKKAKKEKKKK